MESTQPQEQALFLRLQQGFDGSDKPPADVTAFPQRFFHGVRSMLSWIESPLRHTNQEMIPDE